MRLGPAWDRSWDLVFTNEIGRPIDPTNLSTRDFPAAIVAAKLPKIRFHDLRHACASIHLRNKADLKTVAEMLGHRDSAYTMRLYQHVLQDMQEETAQIANAVFD